MENMKNSGNNWENNTKDNPYDNYHGHNQSGQTLENSKDDYANQDPKIIGKDPKNKKHK